MGFSRRGFVQAGLSSAVVLGTGFPVLRPRAANAGPVQPGVRTKFEDFVNDATMFAALLHGVDVMKKRKPSDPTSWFWQGAVHGVSDDLVAQATAIDPNVANVDKKRFWNQCPHGWPGTTPYSAEFLIWHRAYCYYFERILRAASGEPGLAQPYWNYTDPAQRVLPAAYRDQASVLYDPRRDPNVNAGTAALAPGTVDTSYAFAVKTFFGATSTDAFGGTPSDPEPSNEGRIERRPHNGVHGAVGGATGDMGDPATAGFDPIFWAHHMNIDRLWQLWSCVPGVAWGNVPTTSWLNASPWSFYDADKTIKMPQRGSMFSTAKLGIRYDSDDPSCKPLSSIPPSRTSIHVNDLLLAQGVVLPGPGPVEVGASRAIRLGVATTTQVVPLARPRLMRANSNVMLFSAPSPERLILTLSGIAAPERPNVRYDVYGNLPAGATADPKGPSYIGSIDFFALRHGHDAGGPTERFDITALARQPGFDAARLRLTFVPVDLLQAVGSAARVVRRADVRVASATVQHVAARTF